MRFATSASTPWAPDFGSLSHSPTPELPRASPRLTLLAIDSRYVETLAASLEVCRLSDVNRSTWADWLG